ADPGATPGQPGAPPAAADRACQQQRQALSHCERPDPPVEGGRPRSRDGALLCLAQFPGASEPLAAHDLIGINSDCFAHDLHNYRHHCALQIATVELILMAVVYGSLRIVAISAILRNEPLSPFHLKKVLFRAIVYRHSYDIISPVLCLLGSLAAFPASCSC